MGTEFVIAKLGFQTNLLHASEKPHQKQGRAFYAITDGNVIPMETKEVLRGQTVIVENGKIVSLGPK